MTDEEKEFNRRRLLWAKALESGAYHQGHEILTQRSIFPFGPQTDCCLGVACKVAINHGLDIKITINDNNQVMYDHHGVDLPDSVQEWYGLISDPYLGTIKEIKELLDLELHLDPDDTLRVTAIALNDEYELNFKQIAKLIRQNLIKEE